MKRLWIAVVILGLSLALGLAGYLGYQRSLAARPAPVVEPPTVTVERGPVNLTVTAPGKLVNTNTPTLYMSASGIVAEILVRPGDTVQQSDPLVMLANPEMLDAELLREVAHAQQRVADAQVDLEQAQRQRAAMDYPHSTDPLIIEQAWIRYELARLSHKEAHKAFNKVKDKRLLHPKRIQALDALIAAEKAMDDALALYNWYTGTFTELQITQADAAVAVAQAALQQAQTELADLQAQQTGQMLTAPLDGVVLEVEVESGQTVSGGTAAIVLMDPHALEVWTTVIEEDIPLVEIGQLADLYFDALPEAVVTGTISHIMPQSASGQDRPLYYVIVQLAEVPEDLLEGMNLDAAILIAAREDTLRLPRSVIRSAADGSPMVLVWENGQEVERHVELGLRGDLYIEIVSGLTEGERVIAR